MPVNTALRAFKHNVTFRIIASVFLSSFLVSLDIEVLFTDIGIVFVRYNLFSNHHNSNGPSIESAVSYTGDIYIFLSCKIPPFPLTDVILN